MLRQFSMLLVALSVSAQPLQLAKQDFCEEQVVEFPSIGRILIHVVENDGERPAVLFTNSVSGKLLRRLDMGDKEMFTISPGLDEEGTKPRARFEVLHLAGLPDPLIFAAADGPGGSDCAYTGTFVGEADGQLRVLVPQLPSVNAEGGIAISPATGTRMAEVAVWNMIWRDGEAHVDSHDTRVRDYRYDPAVNKFKFAWSYIVKKNSPSSKRVSTTKHNLIWDFKGFQC